MDFSAHSVQSANGHRISDYERSSFQYGAEYFMPLQGDLTSQFPVNQADTSMLEDSADDRSRTTSVSFPNSSETLFPVDFNLTTQLMFERINGTASKYMSSPTETSSRSVSCQSSRKVHELDCSRSSAVTRDSTTDSDYAVGVSLEDDHLNRADVEDDESLSDDGDEHSLDAGEEGIFDLEL